MTNLTHEPVSRQQFFERLGALTDEMIEAYGKDFALGALILTARFAVEGKDASDAPRSVILTAGSPAGAAR
jgi:hypothetical protein